MQHVKVCLLGDPATGGKTAFVQRLVKNSFPQSSKATIGVGFELLRILRAPLRMLPDDSVECSVQLWDIPGQERFLYMFKMYMRDVAGCIVSFDVTRAATFAGVKQWLQLLKDCAPPETPVVVVGNKWDLQHAAQVDDAQVERLAREHCQVAAWHWISVLTGHNVQRSLQSLLDAIAERTSGWLHLDELQSAAARAQKAALTLLLIRRQRRQTTMLHWLPRELVLMIAQLVYQSRSHSTAWMAAPRHC